MAYEKGGLKCGIEIHQQLEGKKLFCSCPTRLRDDPAHFTIQRQLRAVAGEEGSVDIAASQEQQKGKQFLYEGYTDSTCLVELDEEPPHELNQESVYTALQFAKIVGSSVFPVAQVMRKTVVDGSNTSGFQRTALLARKGKIRTSQGEITIENISLEEDACKIVSETAEQKVYRLDRLGIPLIEIGTGPDITSPEQCLEAAKKIGLLLRSLPGVKRGLGTIRQDVNVSIKGGTRIEIKGAQELRSLPLLVQYEVRRQQELLKLKQELKGKTLNPLTIVDVTDILRTVDSKIFKTTIERHGKIVGIKLHGFAGILGRELQLGYRLGTELAGRAKILAGVGGIIHSDEYERDEPKKYGLHVGVICQLEDRLKIGKNDAYILVADEEGRARRALQAVYDRLQELWRGVPPEVRKANPDGTTSFMRPMPGAARMYPETDVPLVRPNTKTVVLPELLDEKITRFQKVLGLSKDLAEFVAKSDHVHLFEEFVKTYPQIKPAYIAETLTSTLLDIKRQYNLDPEVLTEDQLRNIFRYLALDKIHKDIVLDVLIDMIKGTFDLVKYAKLGTEDIHKVLREIVLNNPGAPFSALMGIAMKQLAGKASGQFIAEHLRKIVEQGHR